MNQNIQELIRDAQCVLVGIGTECAYEVDRQDILKKANKDMEDFKDCMWLMDYLVAWEQENAEASRYIKAYNHLYEMVKDKNYFVVTLNTDNLIYQSNFPSEKITAPCGSMGRLQCSCGCEGSIQDAKELARDIAHKVYDEKRSLSDITRPVCSRCNAPLVFNIVGQEKYMEQGDMESWQKYRMWLTGTLNRKLCLLELGTDFSFPSVVRWAFEKVAFINEKATLVRMCQEYPQLTEELQGKGISIKEHPIEYFSK